MNNRMTKKYFTLLCVMLCCVLCMTAHAFAKDAGKNAHLLRMTTYVSTNTITIGDRFTYTVTLVYEPTILIDELNPASWLGMFEIKDYRVIGPKRNHMFSSRMEKTFEYTLSTFTKGEYVIPGVIMGYDDAQGKRHVIRMKPIIIHVVSVKRRKGDRDDIRDIKPVIRAHYPTWYYVVGMLGVLLLVLGLGAYYLYKTKRFLPFFQKQEKEPPHVIALRELEDLRESTLLTRGQTTTYYFMLTEILKKYLEQRFEVPVLDKTTYEAYHVLRDTALDKKLLQDLKLFFEECDLVKFAKDIPDVATTERHFAFAVQVVETTKPVEIQQEEIKE